MTIIDTNVIIDFLMGDKKIVALMGELAKAEKLKTTSITQYELLKHKLKLKRQLAEDFLAELTIYPFDQDAAKQAAKLHQELQDAGKMINENDLLIAGIALANDEVLLTQDQNFSNIKSNNIKII
jgi:tRNA(fMet)-specific endonuclease VapC